MRRRSFLLKRVIIRLIVLYQNKAPAHMRESCLFTPSCSQYMILAIEKHGAILGVLAGIKRIARCRPPNGGTDYP